MPRMIDWHCRCGHVEPDAMAGADDVKACSQCGADMEQDWMPRTRRPAQWDDNTSVLILKGPDGQIRYPGRHDCKVPAGYARVYLRSLQEVNRFEREQGVMNHVMHFDNNGRAIDDYVFGEKVVH